LTALDLGHLMHRDLDLEDVVLHVQGLGAALQVALDAVLVAGVGVHHVPVARQLSQLGGVDLDRVGLGLPGLDVRWLGLPWLGLLAPGLPALRRLTSILSHGLLGLGSPGLLGLGLPSPRLLGLGLLGLGLLGLGLLGLGLRRLTSVLGLYRPTGLRRLTGFSLSSLSLAGLSSLSLAGLSSLSLAGCPGSILGGTTGVHLGLGHGNSFSPLFLAAP